MKSIGIINPKEANFKCLGLQEHKECSKISTLSEKYLKTKETKNDV